MSRATSRILSLLILSALFASSGALAQPGKITDYRIAAQRLYQAWKTHDRAAALRVAPADAVDKLLGVKWRPMRSKGCRQRDEGGFQCVYEDPKLDLRVAFTIDGGVSAGYGVSAVSFSSEE